MIPTPIRLGLQTGVLFPGLALPLSYFAQVGAASRYLHWNQLPLLYATEWIFFAAQGIIVALLVGLSAFAAGSWLSKAVLVRTGLVVDRLLLSVALSSATASWLRGLPVHWPFEIRIGAGLVLTATIFALINNAKGSAWVLRIQKICSWSTGCGALCLAFIAVPLAINMQWRPQSPGAIVENVPKGLPNLVLITADALSASHVTHLGYPRVTTPFLDRLSQKGTTFSRAYAASNMTTPSVASILTGLLPDQHRLLQIPSVAKPALAEHTFPQILHDRGYQTIYFGSNVWAGADRLGLGAGFDQRYPEDSEHHCHDGPPGGFLWCAATMNAWINAFFQLTEWASGLTPVHGRHAAISQRILARLEGWHPDRTRPAFVWIHFMSPHDPYASSAGYLGRFNESDLARTNESSRPRYAFVASLDSQDRLRVLSDRYDESILEVDDAIHRAVDHLQASLGSHTVFVVTSDHGESFSHEYGAHTGPMLFEDIIRIPMVVIGPSDLIQGQLRTDPVSQIDIAPTFAQLAGARKDALWNGRSLLLEPKEDRIIFSMNFEQNSFSSRLTTGSVAAIQGVHKVVTFRGELSYPNAPEFSDQWVDLSQDPHELSLHETPVPLWVAKLTSASSTHFNQFPPMWMKD